MRMRFACGSSVIDLRMRSKRASSVKPDMYMNRCLKVGEAFWKMVSPAGSRQIALIAAAR